MEVRDRNRKSVTSPCRDYYQNGNSGGARNGRLFFVRDVYLRLQAHRVRSRVASSLACALGTQFGQNLVPVVERREE